MCFQNYNYSNCKIIPKKIEKVEIRLFEEEIETVNFLCFYYDLSYEQLLVKLAKEKAELIVEG